MEILIVVAIVAFFIWRRNRKRQQLAIEGYQHALDYANAMNAAPYLKGDGSFSQEVAGESFYGRDFKKLENYIKQVDPGEDEVVFALVPDPSNRHDRNAVRVMAGNLQLGHLPKETAALVQQELIELGGIAKVTGKVHFGKHNSVRLDMRIPLETKD